MLHCRNLKFINNITTLGHYLVIFCFSSENSEFGVKVGGSLLLSNIVKNDF